MSTTDQELNARIVLETQLSDQMLDELSEKILHSKLEQQLQRQQIQNLQKDVQEMKQMIQTEIQNHSLSRTLLKDGIVVTCILLMISYFLFLILMHWTTM